MPSGGGFAFGAFHLDPHTKRLRKDDALVPLPSSCVNVLLLLVSRAGQVVSKEDLLKAGWNVEAMSDSTLAQAIFTIRQALDPENPTAYIQTMPRLGYRFDAPVVRADPRVTDDDLDALLSPHRALMDGRARLESLTVSAFDDARAAFATLVDRRNDIAGYHVGLATACALQFEATRTDLVPNRDALGMAELSAREACRLSPAYGEAFATLGFVLQRVGHRVEALAALRHSTELEPDNWLHWIRRAEANSGQERLFAARRALALLPGCPWAYWLIATVYVQRQMLAEAEHEVNAGLKAIAHEPSTPARFPSVALHWFKGLLCFTDGRDAEGLEAVRHEIAQEGRGHLYEREIVANAYYALGTRYLYSNPADAGAAFAQAVRRVPRHPTAHSGLAILEPSRRAAILAFAPSSVEVAVAHGVLSVHDRDVATAARLVGAALAAAPPGVAGWLIPIEPLLGVGRALDAWAPVLALLRTRGA